MLRDDLEVRVHAFGADVEWPGHFIGYGEGGYDFDGAEGEEEYVVWGYVFAVGLVDGGPVEVGVEGLERGIRRLILGMRGGIWRRGVRILGLESWAEDGVSGGSEIQISLDSILPADLDFAFVEFFIEYHF